MKWSNPGKEVAPSQHVGVVAIEKGTFGSPSTKVTNFTYYKVRIKEVEQSRVEVE